MGVTLLPLRILLSIVVVPLFIYLPAKLALIGVDVGMDILTQRTTAHSHTHARTPAVLTVRTYRPRGALCAVAPHAVPLHGDVVPHLDVPARVLLVGTRAVAAGVR